MKKGFFALALTFAALSASAQSDIFDNPDNKPYFGARLGVEISSTSNDYGIYSNGVGFTAGGVYNIPVYKNLYLEPGVSLFYNNFGEELLYDAPEGGNTMLLNGSIRNWGFHMPIMCGYFFDLADDIRLAPFTGPQFNMSFYAHEKIGSQNESIFGEGGFKHLDMQWIVGLGLNYDKYYVAVYGGIGLTRVESFNTFKFNRNTVNISVGYNF